MFVYICNMEEITKRIGEVITSQGLTNTSFADQIGVKRPIISHILSGRNKPSLAVVLQILETFPEIDPSWLLLGKGSPTLVERVESEEMATPTEEDPKEKMEQPVLMKSDSPQEEPAETERILLIEGSEYRWLTPKN